MSEDTVDFYSAWFCPWAQRVWVSLLEKGVAFNLKEIDPYDKTREFLAVNPRGLVPTLVHNGKSVYESQVCMEYIDEAFPKGPRLMPDDPYSRAQVRIWSDFTYKSIIPNFYKVLQTQDQAGQEEAAAALLKHLETFTKAMHPLGPFFMGPEFTMVDIALLPFSLRFHILKHYRGFQVPESGDFARLQTWMKACHSRPSVLPTVAEEAKLVAKYESYANNTAKTELADAIRQGKIIP